jgi:hypothetical protein
MTRILITCFFVFFISCLDHLSIAPASTNSKSKFIGSWAKYETHITSSSPFVERSEDLIFYAEFRMDSAMTAEVTYFYVNDSCTGLSGAYRNWDSWDIKNDTLYFDPNLPTYYKLINNNYLYLSYSWSIDTNGSNGYKRTRLDINQYADSIHLSHRK